MVEPIAQLALVGAGSRSDPKPSPHFAASAPKMEDLLPVPAIEER